MGMNIKALLSIKPEFVEKIFLVKNYLNIEKQFLSDQKLNLLLFIQLCRKGGKIVGGRVQNRLYFG